MNDVVKKNDLGFFEIQDKPDQSELDAYYREKYYQAPSGQYQKTYSADEREFFENRARVSMATLERLGRTPGTLLELGCGEGFFARFFYDRGVKLFLNDLSSAGIESFNPDLKKYLNVGDSVAHVEAQAAEGRTFDLIAMDNVLEHVIDPIALTRSLRKIMGPYSVVRITVPNDFSGFQQMLLDRDLTENTWVCPPDHLSYFNSVNLAAFLEAQGFEVLSTQVDFPIELFLSNPHSNYWQDRSLGKGAHLSRVLCSNYLINKDIDAYIGYCECAAKLEFGRNTTIYAGLAP